MAEFGSVVGAVECAIAIQQGMVERNSLAPANQRIVLRIGINLGEVIVEGEDCHGDGVNVAARLQQLAEPSSIYVSSKIAREADGRLNARFESIGQQKLKNIALPVEAYRLVLSTLPNSPTEMAMPVRRQIWLVPTFVVLALIALGAAISFRSWEHSLH